MGVFRDDDSATITSSLHWKAALEHECRLQTARLVIPKQTETLWCQARLLCKAPERDPGHSGVALLASGKDATVHCIWMEVCRQTMEQQVEDACQDDVDYARYWFFGFFCACGMTSLRECVVGHETPKDLRTCQGAWGMNERRTLFRNLGNEHRIVFRNSRT